MTTLTRKAYIQACNDLGCDPHTNVTYNDKLSTGARSFKLYMGYLSNPEVISYDILTRMTSILQQQGCNVKMCGDGYRIHVTEPKDNH